MKFYALEDLVSFSKKINPPQKSATPTKEAKVNSSLMQQIFLAWDFNRNLPDLLTGVYILFLDKPPCVPLYSYFSHMSDSNKPLLCQLSWSFVLRIPAFLFLFSVPDFYVWRDLSRFERTADHLGSRLPAWPVIKGENEHPFSWKCLYSYFSMKKTKLFPIRIHHYVFFLGTLSLRCVFCCYILWEEGMAPIVQI